MYGILNPRGTMSNLGFRRDATGYVPSWRYSGGLLGDYGQNSQWAGQPREALNSYAMPQLFTRPQGRFIPGFRGMPLGEAQAQSGAPQGGGRLPGIGTNDFYNWLRQQTARRVNGIPSLVYDNPYGVLND